MDSDTGTGATATRQQPKHSELNRVILLCVCTSYSVQFSLYSCYSVSVTGLLLWYYCFMCVYFLYDQILVFYSADIQKMLALSADIQTESSEPAPEQSRESRLYFLISYWSRRTVTADHVHKSGYFLLRSDPDSVKLAWNRLATGWKHVENMVESV